MRIELPNNWHARDYQLESWRAFRECNVDGGLRRFFKIWHRRAGKDDVDLHHTACSAFERVGNYWYMLPEYNQCRKAIWAAINPHSGLKRIDEAFPLAIRAKTLDQEMKIEFLNGSTFQLMGSDNVDSLVGSPPVGITYSEYGISNPSSWGYLRPILLENNGWAAFNTTPRGKNHAYRLSLMARDSDDWFFEKLTVDDTSVFTSKQLAKELDELISEHGEEYGRALYLQEYFCSFDAAIPGSIWGDALTKLENDGRVCDVPHTAGYPVHSGWDLGKDDDTVIWFYQVIDGELKVIDRYAVRFKDPDHFAEYLRDHGKDEGWRMGTHWLPHDAKHDRQGMYGRTILTQFMDFALQIELESGYDIGEFRIVPSISKQNGIQAGRQMLKIAWFDKSRCELGLDNLKSYHRKYDKEKNKFSEDADHDGASHDGDAWRYVALTWKESRKTQKVMNPKQALLSGSISNMSFGELAKQHFRNKRKQRNSLWK